MEQRQVDKRFDLIGYSRDRAFVVALHSKGGNGKHIKWECKCFCGEKFIRVGSEIRDTKKQFCCRYCARMSRVGEVFGDLTITDYLGKIDGKPHYRLLCSCGNIINLNADQICKRRKSCGCLSNKSHRKLHGLTKTKIYYSWQGMKSRCNNPDDERHIYYGARGIGYSPKWETFDGFSSDMLESYFKGATLDRIDNNKDYCKENCRWVMQEFQKRNQRKRSTNKTGHTGVSRSARSYVAACRWVDGTIVTKSFSVFKYGEQEALEKAIAARCKMIEKLNELGQGYGEYHGLE